MRGCHFIHPLIEIGLSILEADFFSKPNLCAIEPKFGVWNAILQSEFRLVKSFGSEFRPNFQAKILAGNPGRNYRPKISVARIALYDPNMISRRKNDRTTKKPEFKYTND